MQTSTYKELRAKMNVEEGKGAFLRWIFLGFTICFLAVAPFYQGLFFSARVEFAPFRKLDYDLPMYIALMITFVVLGLIGIYLFSKWSIRDYRDFALISIGFIPLVYFISFLHAPASAQMASQSIYVQFMIAAFFMLGMLLSEHERASAVIQQAIMAAGYVIVMFGLLVWYGNIDSPGVIIEDSNGLRLTSVFTYANSYAGMLIAIILGSAYLSARYRKWPFVAIHALFLVPAILSLILTLSRGGLILLPVIFILILPLIPLAKQMTMLFNLLAAAAGSILISSFSTSYGIQLQDSFSLDISLRAWGILCVASVVSALCIVMFGRWVSPLITAFIEKKKLKYGNLYFPILIMLAGAGGFLLVSNSGIVGRLLPPSISQRIASINLQQHSVQERFVFYKDALKILQEYPLLGAGGGAWASLYQKFQDYGYSSRQAHNYIIQTLTDVGIVGALLIFILILGIYVAFVRNAMRNWNTEQSGRSMVYFIVGSAILVHSWMDFDMSYMYLSCLVFLCLGGMLSGITVKPIPSGASSKPFQIVKWAYPSILIVISLMLFIQSAILLQGNMNIRQVQEQLKQGNVNLSEVIPALDSAISANPNIAEYRLIKINLLLTAFNQLKDKRYIQQAVDAVQALKRKEPFDKEAAEYEYLLAVGNQDEQQALEAASRAMVNNPWNMTWYARMISLNVSLGEKAQAEGKAADSQKYGDDALSVYDQILANQKHLETVPKSIAVPPFAVSSDIYVNIGGILYKRGEYRLAEETLQKGLTADLSQDGNQKQLALLYLASKRRQGQDDAALYDKLIAIDAEAGTKLNGLLEGM
ncbi:O-antigen ligase family protein [Paenibacillus chartarius]|uniref:O-antigen ligase family protein n=1 Tax=Paenibacillus chartarius TaxID=747481 RepID=A0ABV6DN36_9BACL